MLEKNSFEKFERCCLKFRKFIVGRSGVVVKYFAPDISPEDPVIVNGFEEYLAYFACE